MRIEGSISCRLPSTKESAHLGFSAVKLPFDGFFLDGTKSGSYDFEPQIPLSS